jgi:hypothetical protein
MRRTTNTQTTTYDFITTSFAMSSNPLYRPPHWPVAHEHMLDDLPSTHWFARNSGSLVRTPTLAELCSPYVPLDILGDPEEAKRQRLDLAIRSLAAEADRSDSMSRGGPNNSRALNSGFQMYEGNGTFYNEGEIGELILNTHVQGSSSDQTYLSSHSAEPMNHATSAGPSTAIHNATNIYGDDQGFRQGRRSTAMAHNPVVTSEQREAINHAANYIEGQPLFVSDEVTNVTAHNDQNIIVSHTDDAEDIHGIPHMMPPVAKLPIQGGSTLRRSERSGVAVSSRMQKAASQRQGPKLATLDEMVPSSRPEAKAYLVKLFREEILYDHTKRQEQAAGLQSKQLSVHGQRMKQLKQAIANFGKVGGLPLLVMSNITRHDWKGLTGLCIYTIDLDGGPRSGTGESLAAYYAGVDYTLWEYWGAKNRIRPHHVRQYINSVEQQGFYQEIMWPHLPEREWLALWRERRTSGRV